MKRPMWLILVLLLAFGLVILTSCPVKYEGKESRADDDTTDDDTDDDTGDDTDDDTDDDVEEPPAAPTNLEVVEVKKYQATLNWDDNSDNEDGFIVERQTVTKAWQQIADLPANTEEYTDTGLECDGKNYQYRIKAYNDVGDSGYSNTDDATTLECWTIYTLDSAGDVGDECSIAIDSSDKVHISYKDAAYGDLKYATNKSGSWQTFMLDSAGEAGWFSSIALDSSDKVHISHYAGHPGGHLQYTTNKSGEWQSFTLDSSSETGRWSSIAIDSNNKVHISQAYKPWPDVDLRYTTNLGGSWQTFTIDSSGAVGLLTSLALDSNNKVHISYYDCGTSEQNCDRQDLKYATNSSGSWQTFTLDSAGYVGKGSSIAIDSNNKVHISYGDLTSGNVKYITNQSGSWQTYVIGTNTPTNGVDTSIAIDSSNKVHIAYYDVNGNLKYATNKSGSWIIYTIDSAGIIGLGVSMALDSNDHVHICYSDEINHDLKYATNAEVE